jgi:hypothetical protein
MYNYSQPFSLSCLPRILLCQEYWVGWDEEKEEVDLEKQKDF